MFSARSQHGHELPLPGIVHGVVTVECAICRAVQQSSSATGWWQSSWTWLVCVIAVQISDAPRRVEACLEHREAPVALPTPNASSG